MEFHLGAFEHQLSAVKDELLFHKVVERIWKRDFTVWKDNPDEISNRLGWLDLPENMIPKLDEINDFTESVLRDGFENVVLLGMGGSSLAPEVFRLTFGVKENYPDLSVLDTTDPVYIEKFAGNLDFEKSLFIVSTKSGGTVETLSLMKFFFNLLKNRFGEEKAANHFVAITDPGSKLEKLAKDFGFRKVFLNAPDIGGRFSALSYFGLVPASLVGIDIRKILDNAGKKAEVSKQNANFIALFGAFMGGLAELGVDKLTFITSNELKYFQAWAEQLIAESTGKEGKGILPVVDEPVLGLDEYSNDRFFVIIKYSEDDSLNNVIDGLKTKNFPYFIFNLENDYDLGGEFFAWEFATAVAGWALKIQPFDQPNVESAKAAARETIRKYSETGKLPEPQPDFVSSEGIKFFGGTDGNNISEILTNFIEQKNALENPPAYLAIQAFVTPDKENYDLLQRIRTAITKKYGYVCTVGFGPRFLHSTGQLHKGDAGKGIFLQFMYEPDKNLPIPDELGTGNSSITFDILLRSQALGDRQALLDAGRKILSVDLGFDSHKNLKLLSEKF